ncbi:MAG: GLPGLI family protein [Bacteroidetes bacterium]|nr:MAG: GLPGLI family protein [Bacteroidota bacterium]
MLKKIIYSGILLMICQSLIIKIPCFSQYANAKTIDNAHIILTYMLEYHQDSTNLDDKRGEEMLLFIGSNHSLFMSYSRVLNDTIRSNLSRAEQMGVDQQTLMNQFTSSMQSSRFRYRLYKNYRENTLSFHQYVQGTYFLYEEPLNSMRWELIAGEERVIQNYQVTKATTYYGGRNWVAWFAPEIPISDGPYKFSGLPGLIIKIEDTKGHYVFTLTSFENLHSPRPIELIPRDNEVITNRKDFLRTVEKFRANIIHHAQDMQLAPESQRRAAENMRRRNNPIELKAD